MFITKSVLPGYAPFYLCRGRGARPFTWASSMDRAYDLGPADALDLAKRLKLIVCQIQPGCLHVVGVLGTDKLNGEKVVSICEDAFDYVNAGFAGEALAFSGGEHKFALQVKVDGEWKYLAQCVNAKTIAHMAGMLV